MSAGSHQMETATIYSTVFTWLAKLANLYTPTMINSQEEDRPRASTPPTSSHEPSRRTSTPCSDEQDRSLGAGPQAAVCAGGGAARGFGGALRGRGGEMYFLGETMRERRVDDCENAIARA